MLADWQAYSQLYYDNRVKATAEKEWEEELSKQKETERDGEGKSYQKLHLLISVPQ
jgi:hypothetical protein